MQGEAVESPGIFSLHILLNVLYYIVQTVKRAILYSPFPGSPGLFDGCTEFTEGV